MTGDIGPSVPTSSPEPNSGLDGSKRQFRVVWQRDGCEKRRKILGTRAGAERYVARLRGELDPLPGRDDDEYACCSGYECGCHGETVAQAREQIRDSFSTVPVLVYGPVIEERPVGEWSPSSSGPSDSPNGGCV